MLGTLIFEQWDDRDSVGKECKLMLDGKIIACLDLSSKAKTIDNLHYAEQLVKIC
jgi:hypothetical protein